MRSHVRDSATTKLFALFAIVAMFSVVSCSKKSDSSQSSGQKGKTSSASIETKNLKVAQKPMVTDKKMQSGQEVGDHAISGVPLFPIPKGMSVVHKGKFWMGCKPEIDGKCEESDKPGREVYLDMFFIDRTEVTVAQYKSCVDSGSCSAKGLDVPSWDGKEQKDWAWACNWAKPGREQHPMNCISWSQANTYCKWLDKRLPTEAEWEKAARGTDARKYAWGNTEYADLAKSGKKVANIADEAAHRRDPKWTVAKGYDDGFAATSPVASFPDGRSPCGAFDMTGNVLEWVADWYDADYYKKGPASNPKGPEKGDMHVARGGAWYGEPSTTRISLRWPNPIRRLVAVGFRCAATPPKVTQ